METIGDLNTVRAKVILAGYHSLSAWAREHGYLPVTVRWVVRNWGHRIDPPHGGIGRQIMSDLRATLGAPKAEAA